MMASSAQGTVDDIVMEEETLFEVAVTKKDQAGTEEQQQGKEEGGETGQAEETEETADVKEGDHPEEAVAQQPEGQQEDKRVEAPVVEASVVEAAQDEVGESEPAATPEHEPEQAFDAVDSAPATQSPGAGVDVYDDATPVDGCFEDVSLESPQRRVSSRFRLDSSNLDAYTNTIKVTIPIDPKSGLGVVLADCQYDTIVPGVFVSRVMANTAAAKSGALQVGDQVLTCNGKSLVALTFRDALKVVREETKKGNVTLEIVRQQTIFDHEVPATVGDDQLGIVVRNTLIVDVLEGSLAEQCGIQLGHHIIKVNQRSTVDMDTPSLMELIRKERARGPMHMQTAPQHIMYVFQRRE